jgi:hypothetical protein
MAGFLPPDVSPQAIIDTQVNLDHNMPADRAAALQGLFGSVIPSPDDVIGPIPAGPDALIVHDIHMGEPLFVRNDRVEVASTGLSETRKYGFVAFNGLPVPPQLRGLPPKRRQREFNKLYGCVGVAGLDYSFSSSTQSQHGITALIGGAVPMVPRVEPFTAGFYGTVAIPPVDRNERELLRQQTNTNGDFPHNKTMAVLRRWNPYGGVQELEAAICNHLMADQHLKLGLEALDSTGNGASSLETDDEISLTFSRAVLGAAAMVIAACEESGALVVPAFFNDAAAVRTWRDSITDTVTTHSYDQLRIKRVNAATGVLEDAPNDADSRNSALVELFGQLGLIAQPNGLTKPLPELKTRALGFAMHTFFDHPEARDAMDVMTLNESARVSSMHNYLESNNAWKQLQRLQANSARDWLRVSNEVLHLNYEQCHVRAVQNSPVGVSNLFILQ